MTPKTNFPCTLPSLLLSISIIVITKQSSIKKSKSNADKKKFEKFIQVSLNIIGTPFAVIADGNFKNL